MKALKCLGLVGIVMMLAGCMSDCSTGNNGTTNYGARGTKPYSVGGRTYYPLKSSGGFSETGTASWYGPKFHGKQTASGEKYDQYKMTAAHKTLPFGTQVRVTNLDNNRSTVVRINDRGPFVGGRIIDLSRVAAEQLDMIGTGTARVRVDSIGNTQVAGTSNTGTKATKVTPSDTGNVYIQVGSFGQAQNAQNMSAQVTKAGYKNRVHTLASGMTAVQIGPWANRAVAEGALDDIRSEYPGAFIVK